MDKKTYVWIAYLAVALITLLSKLASYVYTGTKKGDSIGKSIKDWFFEKTLANGASWVGTIVFVWAFGYIYVEGVFSVLGFFGAFFQKLPVACPIGALLGWGAEMGAPDACKWLIKKFTPKD